MISAGAKLICATRKLVYQTSEPHSIRPRSWRIGTYHDFLADPDVLIEINFIASSHRDQDLARLKSIFFILRVVVSNFERVVGDARFTSQIVRKIRYMFVFVET